MLLDSREQNTANPSGICTIVRDRNENILRKKKGKKVQKQRVTLLIKLSVSKDMNKGKSCW